MLNGLIPPHVDPYKLAERETVLQGQVALASLARLCEALADTMGTVQAQFHFGYDEQHVALIRSTLEVEVKMVCQRCLGLVALPIRSECVYAVVRKGAGTQSLPKGYDVLELDNEPLKLLDMLEDELLLALPIVPVHMPEDCQQLTDKSISDLAEDAWRPNPFSVLARLKRDSND